MITTTAVAVKEADALLPAPSNSDKGGRELGDACAGGKAEVGGVTVGSLESFEPSGPVEPDRPSEPGEKEEAGLPGSCGTPRYCFHPWR